MTEQEYLEDNIATVAFHLGRPGARLSVQNDLSGLVVDPGEVLKEVSRRLDNHDALVKALTELLDICESLGDFKNGVVHNCIDEGEVYAGQLIDQARDALTLVGASPQQSAVDK